ncbi:hypothetical protein [Burkholderia mayonis]|uniref:hypothetical protein n=1 Tax=Burkholderia mayonis TaxID=1385591 RepID=UPI000A90B70B|nr:hypothetical protein [Burkholderia mayonis]
MKKITLIILLAYSTYVRADCVYNLQSATMVRILDYHALVIYGGGAGYTLIKTLTPLSPGMPLAVGSDSFCDYASNALFSGSMPIDIQSVKHLN